MNRPAVRLIPGYHDLTGPEERSRAAVEAALFDYSGLAGYRPIETPLLEEADLFLRKSGGELASRMYAFTDPGGHRVALRPEFTASIIRAFIARARQDPLPVRWRYAGPVFRYAPQGQGPLHQRTQVGAEFIGQADSLADVEVLALACGGLRHVGLTGFTIGLGHLGVVQRLLKGFCLSERAELFLMGNIGALQDSNRGMAWVRDQAMAMGLTRDAEVPASGLADMNVEEVRAVLHQMMTGLDGSIVGGRDLEQVQERFLEKLRTADRPETLEQALCFIAALCSLRGDPDDVLARAAETATAYALDPEPLEGLTDLLHLAQEGVLGGARLVLDLGLVRGLAYYTGMVFEIWHPQEAESLCGGGRYDGLVWALGGEEVPALGFAYGVEAVLGALQAEGERSPGDASAVDQSSALLAQGAVSPARALQAAVERWDAGLQAELAPACLSHEEAQAYAAARGIQSVILVTEKTG